MQIMLPLFSIIQACNVNMPQIAPAIQNPASCSIDYRHGVSNEFQPAQQLRNVPDYQQFQLQQSQNRAKLVSVNEKHSFASQYSVPPLQQQHQSVTSDLNMTTQNESATDQGYSLKQKANGAMYNIKPASNAQINRLLSTTSGTNTASTIGTSSLLHPSGSFKQSSEENANLMSFIRTENKYNDMLAENASFIDSPIHLLMSHHNNQRLIKQQQLKKHQYDFRNKSFFSQENEAPPLHLDCDRTVPFNNSNEIQPVSLANDSRMIDTLDMLSDKEVILLNKLKLFKVFL